MRHLRAISRLLLLIALTLFAYLTHVAGNVVAWPAPGPGRRVQGWALHTWARGICRLLRARVEIDGDPPDAPFLLVCNHLGYFDVVVLATRLHCYFVAKSEVARWPVIGHLAAVAHTIFVQRGRRGDLPRVVQRIQRAIGTGAGVVFFPEGTSSKGEMVLPFKASLFEAALQLGLPVSCASLSYATAPGAPPAHEAVCWWGDMTFFPHLYELLQVPSFSARLVFHPDRFPPTGRKELAEATHQVVESGFVPVVT